MPSPLHVAILHYPVYDKNRDVVTTAVTNIDVHDIARSCCTYGVERFYVVTPVDALRGLVRRIIRHWDEGDGREYNPNRSEALSLVRLEATLEGVEIDIERRYGVLPRLIGTSARPSAGAESFASVRHSLETTEAPSLLILGTGWGLTEAVMSRCHCVLEPIVGPSAYNHLSVRAAAAILLDRLRSPG
ncbi:MAG TPA: RNA methyltransferase [Candidatus Binatia bacterium]|nr:RNA methyltransferase [Candidatus Binatia bacterium]